MESQMSEENLAVVDPAPEQVATAAPEPVVEAPELAEKQQSKTFTQEELDAAIGKRLAREQRAWERRQAQREAEMHTLKAAPVQSADQFESTEAYAEALAEQKIAQRESAQLKAQILENYHEKEEEARSKYEDFEQVAYNPKLPITSVMAEAIQSSEIGPELAYHLGTNPKEADRISKLSPLGQAREIGRIEAKLAASPPVKRTSSAPAPITPVTARSTGSPAYDTTDPRSIKTMTDSQWIEAERARQIKKLQAQAIR